MRKRKHRRRWRRLGVWALAALATFYCLCALRLFWLRWSDPWWTGVQIQRAIANWLSGRSVARRYEPVPLSRISDHLETAVIVAEDARFFEHRGIDWAAVREAAEANWKKGAVRRGGSTITQQLVKNLFFTTHQSWSRKLLEASLAYVAEWILPKRRILELYLNVAEWGPGVFGAEAAAQHHYGIPAAALSREQAARLVACLPAPLRRKPQAMDRYASIILRRMRKR